VLLVLGILNHRQQEELSRSRTAEETRSVLILAQRRLLTRLETIKLRASAGEVLPGDSEVALVSSVMSERLVPPWEQSQRDPAASRTAEQSLREIAALYAAGKREQAAILARRLLSTPVTITDEYGIPFAIYASQKAGGKVEYRNEVAARVEQILATAWLPPSALYMIAGLPQLGSELTERARFRAQELEQIGDLSPQISMIESVSSDPVWRLAGEAPWIVGVGGRSEDRQRTVIVVRIRKTLESIPLPGHSRFVLDKDPVGEPLGESFPGIRLAVDAGLQPNRALSNESFYLAGFILVSVAAFSAWLLHRDIRRESWLAHLRSQFVSSVSHELRTPIAAIRAYAELIDMGRSPGPRETSEYLKTIIGESEKLSRLVEGVLEFSKTERGKRNYHFSSVSIEQVVRSAARALDYSLASGGFQLRMEIDSALPKVNADPEALEQAVVNLLTNAIKYSGENRDIDLSLHREGDHAVIRVRDQGIGIALEEQSRIFESFYRAPLATERNVPGAGLGLTLADHIVKAHRGRIQVESLPGAGSTFSILLPIREGA
jgi:signal transduction histidine kinase